jgi:hypothetical protein
MALVLLGAVGLLAALPPGMDPDALLEYKLVLNGQMVTIASPAKEVDLAAANFCNQYKIREPGCPELIAQGMMSSPLISDTAQAEPLPATREELATGTHAPGKFVRCDTCSPPDPIYWYGENQNLHHIESCEMCGLNICGLVVDGRSAPGHEITPAFLKSHAIGPTFRCCMLPGGEPCGRPLPDGAYSFAVHLNEKVLDFYYMSLDAAYIAAEQFCEDNLVIQKDCADKMYMQIAKQNKAQPSGKCHRDSCSVQLGAMETATPPVQGGLDAPAVSIHTGKEQAQKEAEQQARKEAEEQARKEAEEQARKEAEEQARKEAEEQAQKEAEEQARKEAEEQAQKEAEEQARKEAEEQARKEAEQQARKEAEQQARKEAEEQARKEAEEQARKEAKEHARKEAEEQAQREAEEQVRMERARKEAEERARKQPANPRAAKLAEVKRRAAQLKMKNAKAKADQASEVQRERKELEEKTRRKAEEQVVKHAEERARKEAEQQARKEAEEQAQKEAEEQARKEAEQQARKEAEEQARKEAEEQARKEAEEQVMREAEEEAEEAVKQAKKEAEQQEQAREKEEHTKEAAAAAAAAVAKRARVQALQVEERARTEAAERAKQQADEKAAMVTEEEAKEAQEIREREAEARRQRVVEQQRRQQVALEEAQNAAEERSVGQVSEERLEAAEEGVEEDEDALLSMAIEATGGDIDSAIALLGKSGYTLAGLTELLALVRVTTVSMDNGNVRGDYPRDGRLRSQMPPIASWYSGQLEPCPSSVYREGAGTPAETVGEGQTEMKNETHAAKALDCLCKEGYRLSGDRTYCTPACHMTPQGGCDCFQHGFRLSKDRSTCIPTLPGAF